MTCTRSPACQPTAAGDHLSRDLVTEHPRRHHPVVSKPEGLHVRTTDRGTSDPEQHVARPGYGRRRVFDADVAGSVETYHRHAVTISCPRPVARTRYRMRGQ